MGTKGLPPTNKIDLDTAQVAIQLMAEMQCTDAEIAARMGCCPETIKRRKANEPEFREMLDKHRALGKATLREKQWRKAENGNITMLIWLGKQYLGQSDRSDLTSSNAPLQFTFKINGRANGKTEQEAEASATPDG
jgi:hypothetical protein